MDGAQEANFRMWMNGINYYFERLLKLLESHKAEAGEWQVCPKCGGWGGVEGDPIPGSTTPRSLVCPVCNGAKVLRKAAGEPESPGTGKP